MAVIIQSYIDLGTLKRGYLNFYVHSNYFSTCLYCRQVASSVFCYFYLYEVFVLVVMVFLFLPLWLDWLAPL